MKMGGKAKTRPLYPREKDPVPLVQEAGWAGRARRIENFSTHWGPNPEPSNPELVANTEYYYIPARVYVWFIAT